MYYVNTLVALVEALFFCGVLQAYLTGFLDKF